MSNQENVRPNRLARIEEGKTYDRAQATRRCLFCEGRMPISNSAHGCAPEQAHYRSQGMTPARPKRRYE